MNGLRCCALALGFAPAVVGAQRISGIAKMPGDGQQNGGVLVIVSDGAGAEVARTVTTEEGRFALPLPRPGDYKVELHRVGYEPTVALNRAVAAGEAVAIDQVLTTRNTTLPNVTGITPNSCGGSADGQLYVATLWEEARKAMLATQLGLGRQGVTARWAVTDHRLAGNGRDTSRFTVSRKQGNLLTAFGTPVQAELARSGFVIAAGKDRIFRGFDLGTLLSPWFLESYCLTAREAGRDYLALDFAPKTRRRDYVDVTGTITFSRVTLEVVSIDYLYVGLSADEDKRQAGGQMRFARADGGTWLVSDWYIRFPMVGYIELETFRTQDRGRIMQPEVVGHEFLAWQATALLEGTKRVYVRDAIASDSREGPIRSACTERVLASPTGAARGRLTLDERPVSGARIRATWRTQLDVGGEIPLWRDEVRETLTSNRGDWTLCDLPAGQTVELSWEVMGRKTSNALRVDRDQLVTVGSDGKVER